MATSESVKGDARTRNVTDAADPSDARTDSTGSGLEWEDVDGRRRPEERYAIYRLCTPGDERSKELVATCGTPEALGVALVTLGREGEWEGCPVGVLDRMGEPGQKWIIRPWLPSARNVSDAGRTLRGARRP